ncbi:UNVERIFIED_CONTAM: Transposon Ty3-I Gag-Pol polyprotein [Sesamum calycinum]|uniref:Transposon Ty3-I Gag-Pol polyprotein n=1 Tax=Sesamum calycinum TaxID=2727403 RepID=A0AAW2P7M6_9LAMI
MADQTSLCNRVAELESQKTVGEWPEMLDKRVMSAIEEASILTDAVDVRVDGVQAEVNLLKRVVGRDDDRAPMSKVKVPDPKPFGGARSVKELENFPWDMETYFQAARIPEAEKVSITSMYLTGDAKLWWRTCLSDDAVRIGTRLRRGTHRERLCEGVQLSDAGRSGHVRGGQTVQFPVGTADLGSDGIRRQGVKDLPSAIAAADRLVDFRVTNNSDPEKKRRILERRRGSPRGKLNALVAEADDDEGGSPRVNPLQLVSALQERPPTQKGLMHVRVQINGKAVMAMLDSGAIHNFVADREIQKLGLTLAQHSSRIKAVNLEAKPIQGAAGVELKVGAWTGQCKLLAVPLDDFDVILGMDFMLLANAMVMPYLNGLFIANPSSTCFVQGTYLQDSVRSTEKKDSLMSAMQVKAGLRRGDQTYLAALIEIKPDVVQEVPDEVAELLQEFKDVFPPELPKKLPPRRAIDHAIELEPGARPPAQAPYRMAPAELAELRKQLDGLLEAGLVQPSKAPYGSPVLFQRKQDGSMRMCVDYRAAKLEDQKWEWTVACEDAFKLLKQAISSQPVLKLPQFDRPFEVQARWQEFLGEFDFEWVHRPGKHNDVADALSRILVEEYVAALTVVESDFLDQIRESSKTDVGYLKLVEYVKSGLIPKYWLDSGLLYAKGGRVFVPTGTLRRRLLRETHDPQWAGHPGIDRMIALSSSLDKVERKKEAGLLQPLPIPEVPWQSVSMDFITGFPKGCLSEGFGALFNMMGTELKFSTANHPQTDGQTERVNALVEDYLRHYVPASQRNWVDLLDVAQFSYNLHKSSATGMSPFELAYGQQATTPHEISVQRTGGKCPAAYRYARSKQELLDEAKDSLAKAQGRMKKYANMGRRHVEFSAGDQDLLDAARQQTQRAPPVIRKEFEKTACASGRRTVSAWGDTARHSQTDGRGAKRQWARAGVLRTLGRRLGKRARWTRPQAAAVRKHSAAVGSCALELGSSRQLCAGTRQHSVALGSKVLGLSQLGASTRRQYPGLADEGSYTQAVTDGSYGLE